MATPPKTTTAGPAHSDEGATGPAPPTAPHRDLQKVDFDFDPELKRQLDAGGSYKPPAEKIADEYIPPGPHPIGPDGMGGAAGGHPIDKPANPLPREAAKK